MGTVPALTDETPLDQYTATASQTEFTFTFMIFATSDIKVYVNDVLKTETTDYVVKQADLSAIVPADDLPMDGGKIVFNSGLTVSDAVSISREIPIDRLTGYSVAGAFRANVLNTELTRMQAINQQLERDLARTIQLSASDAEGGSLVLPGSRANQFLAFDANGDLIMSAGSADSITVSTFMATVLDDTTAAAARTTMGLAIGSDVQAYDAELAALAGLTSAANKVPYFTGSGTAGVLDFKDEDNMSSDSATAVASQQSIKAYVDSNLASAASETVAGVAELATQTEVNTGTDTSRIITPATFAGSNYNSKELVASGVANNDSTIDFSDVFEAGYNYHIEIANVRGSTDSYLRCRLRTGTTYQSSNYVGGSVNGSPVDGPTGNTSGTGSMDLTSNAGGWGVESTSTKGVSGTVHVWNPGNTSTHKQVSVELGHDNQSGNYNYTFGAKCYEGSTLAVNGIQFFMASGNIYGIFRIFRTPNA